MKCIFFVLLFFISLQNCSDIKKNENFKLLGIGTDLIPDRFKILLIKITVEQVLKNTAEGFILPVYKDLKQETKKLEEIALEYEKNSSSENLKKLQDQWKKSRNVLKKAEVVAFGPARYPEKYFFSELPNFDDGKYYIEMDSFSTRLYTSVSDVQTVLKSSEKITQEEVKNFNTEKKGYAALEYLIFDNGSGSKEIQAINQANQNAVRKSYIISLCKDISYQANKLEDSWKRTSNSFLSDFTDGNSKSKNEHFQDALNGLSYSLTYIIDFKIGEPSGLRETSKGSKNLNRMESKYSNYSFEDLKNNLIGFEQFYQANYDNTARKSISSYIANKNTDLDQRVKDSLEDLKQTLVLLSNKNTSLTKAMTNDFESVKNFFIQAKNLRIIIVNEVIPAAGVLALPSDTDGD